MVVVTVVVASKSAVKVEAARRAFDAAATTVSHLLSTAASDGSDGTAGGTAVSTGSVSVNVVPMSSASGVSEQPVGHAETRRGAANRLDAALEGYMSEASGGGAAHSGTRPEPDFIVAIENGIVDLSGVSDDVAASSDATSAGSWYDLAWVAIRDCSSGYTAFVPGTGLPLNPQWVDAALHKSSARPSSDALGRVTVGDLLAEATTGDGKDPHSMLSAGLLPRAASLEAPLLGALGDVLRRRHRAATGERGDIVVKP